MEELGNINRYWLRCNEFDNYNKTPQLSFWSQEAENADDVIEERLSLKPEPDTLTFLFFAWSSCMRSYKRLYAQT